MAENEAISNVELEIKKFIDISTIFKKLKEQGAVKKLYGILQSIFLEEHTFTTNGKHKKL
jgi:hypothetical protein